jgi:GMP synthase (glutamine-hydrolysing)
MHVDFEPPGIIEKWARDGGHVLDGTLTSTNKDLPNAADIDFLIVLGGPQSPLRMNDYPYLRDEINLISTMIRQNKPIIGFCLGSQLIAEALGARTRKSPHKEVGGFAVQLTEDGRKDPVFKDFPPEFEVIQWHHDMPGIPDGATLLARSAGCPHQAFRFGDRVYGFEFHLEPTRESIKPLLENGVGDLEPSEYTQTSEKILSFDFETMNRRMTNVLDTIVNISSQGRNSDRPHPIGRYSQ